MSKQQVSKPNAAPVKETAKAYVIASDFRDKADFHIEYKAGQPAIFEPVRLAELIAKGLVK